MFFAIYRSHRLQLSINKLKVTTCW